MSEKRVLKKYPNRRLYDTVESKYITLRDVRRLVLKEIDFCVTDKKTGEDITRNVLLQIILEQEEDGEPIFTTDILTQIIRFYGDAVQGLASQFLKRSLSMFCDQQELFHSQVNNAMNANPLAAISELTQKNLELWRRMQNDFFNAAGMRRPARDNDTAKDSGADDP